MTGDKGLIGGILQKELPQYGYEISGYDKKDGLELNNTDCLTEHLKGNEAVVHLAGIPGPWGEDWELYQYNNVDGTLSVIEACRRAKVGRIVYASSGAVYGMSNGKMEVPELPLTEGSPLALEPLCYDRSKILCEQHLAGAEDIKARIALRLETPTPHAIPLASHLWASITEENLGRAFHAALKADFIGFGAFNIGNDQMGEKFDSIAFWNEHYPGSRSSILYPREPLYCIRKAKEILGYVPTS